VPVDGEVYQGSSTITIEHLTGETKPVERTVGDAIPGGARNLEGMMIVKVRPSLFSAKRPFPSSFFFACFVH
jgi:Zn2+/Cd2+-exporting ATPase